MQELVLIQPIRAADEKWTQEAAHAAGRREFEARLAECGPLAYRVARGVLRNDAGAGDGAHEVLLRAYLRVRLVGGAPMVVLGCVGLLFLIAACMRSLCTQCE